MQIRVFATSLFILTLLPRLAFPEGSVSIASDGWQVTADGDAGLLTIAHERLGIILGSAHLAVRGVNGVEIAHHWSARTTAGNELEVKVAAPAGSWRFRLTGNTVLISTTSSHSLLRATAPASASRIAVRLVDQAGFPVEWTGTDEIKQGYGSPMTANHSYLPRTNPDTMYFSLGLVSGSQFHSLFDRKSDTAIQFAQGTLMERSANSPDTLDISMPVPGNSLIRVIPDYYTKSLGLPFYVPFDDSVFKTAPMVWSSWTSYYAAVTERDVVSNADWLAAHLKPYGFQYVQLDDGYDRGSHGQHSWIEGWSPIRFPHGPQWLTAYIKSKGLRAGLWLVPNAYAGAVQTHPDWYVRDRQGKILLDYATPTLDSTNPQVLAFEKHLFTTLDNWGFDYYKFDGEHAFAKYVPAVDRTKLYNPNADLLANYRDRLRIIRDTIGPDRFLEVCPAGSPLNGIGYVDSYFNGQDLYANWQGMYPLFSSITANAFLNHLAVYVMSGEGLELGKPMTVAEAAKKRPPQVIETEREREDSPTGIGVTDAEARTLVTYIALTGVAYPLASVMTELPPDRLELLKKTMPTQPILPMDLFSRGTDIDWATFKHVQSDSYIHNYPEVLDLKVNSESSAYDVTAVTNWRSQPLTRDIVFGDELGLDSTRSYVAFDFWNEKLLGVFKNRISVNVSPHDTRVLFICPALNRPQFLGTSRHITGAFSVSSLSWDSAKHMLSGISQAVPSDTYKLWIYLPEPAKLGEIRASSKAVREIPMTRRIKGNLLTLSFEGQSTPIDWRIEFRN